MSLKSFRSAVLKAAVLATAFAGTLAEAQLESTTSESQSKIKIDKAIPPGEAGAQKPNEVDTDEVITNRKLRAETGSKKKYSVSTTLSYDGGAIKSPLADTRPNIKGSVGVQVAPRLGGSVGFNYKLTSLNTIFASVGVGVDRPFHSDPNKNFRQRSSASNPTVGFQTVYKALGLQNVTRVSASAYTTDYLRTNGYAAGALLSQTLVYDFGGSRASIGTSLQVSNAFFDKNTPQIIGNQADWSIGAFPFFEYVFTDRLNFRTLVGFMADHGRGESDWSTWIPNKPYQSIGLGISVTRDIFLYPNVQLIPEDIRADLTNVGLTATVNL